MMPDAPAPTALKVLEMARAGRFADITRTVRPAPAADGPGRGAAGRLGRRDGPARPGLLGRRTGQRTGRAGDGGEGSGDLRAGSVHAGRVGHRGRLADRSPARTARGRAARRAVAAARLRGCAALQRGGGHGRDRAPRGAGDAEPATLARGRQPGPRHPAVVLLSGSGAARPGRDHRAEQAVQGPRLGPGQSRHRGTPLRQGHLRPRPARCAKDRDFTVADEYIPRRGRRGRTAAAASRRWTPTGSSCSATASAAPSPRGSRWPNRPSPGWSSWPAARSRCTGPPSARSATWPRSTRRRPRPRSPSIDAMSRQAAHGRQPGPVPVDAGQRAAVRRPGPVLAGSARLRPGGRRRDAAPADADRPGRPGLPGDRAPTTWRAGRRAWPAART